MKNKLLMNILPKYKCSQSQIVATVLLILLVIVAVTIISAFAIPFVRDQLSKSDCLSVSGNDNLGISESLQYTCYNSSGTPLPEMYIQVHVGDIYDKINGFSIEIGGAITESYEITKDYFSPEISSYGPGGVEVPGKNEERTYRISVEEIPQTLKIYPILANGETCDYSDSLTSIPICAVF